VPGYWIAVIIVLYKFDLLKYVGSVMLIYEVMFGCLWILG